MDMDIKTDICDVSCGHIGNEVRSKDSMMWALAYAQRRCWPIAPGEPRSKHPTIRRWPETATSDAQTIRRWYDAHPPQSRYQNVHLICGQRSGILVIDIDGEAGTDSICEMQETHGALPATLTSHQARHLLYKIPKHVGHVPSLAGLRSGVDVRADGGQIPIDPSTHPDGHIYSWQSCPWHTHIAEAPQWLIEMILKNEQARPRSRCGGAKARSRNGEGSDLRTHVINSRNDITTPAIDHMCSSVPSRTALIYKLRHMSLGEYLGQDTTPTRRGTCICCPLHDDSRPSADLYEADDDGASLLYCHSGCGTHDMISLQMAMTGQTMPDALRDLMRMYNITYDSAICDEALTRISDLSDYPALARDRSIQAAMPTLTRIIGLMREAHQRDGWTDAHGRPMMMASYRWLCDELGVYYQTLNRRLRNLKFYDLICTLRDADVPDPLLECAKRSGQSGRRTSIWALPRYTNEYLRAVEASVRGARASGHTAPSRTTTHVVRGSDGIEAAQRIAPQSRGTRYEPDWQALWLKVKRGANDMLAQRGYYYEPELAQRLGWRSADWIKKMRTWVLREFNLVGLQTNGPLREAYGVASNGYPVIYIRGDS